jgi:CheY-like chemotaxis protein
MSSIFMNITHELLTPLTVISASVDKLREEEPKFGRHYDMMQLNIQRMVRLLQQILETSKSEAGGLKLLVAQGDVMGYIHETAECLEPLIAKKKMIFKINCVPESMMGWIDTDKLDKIIYNLLSNAAKYSKEGGEVSIEAVTNRTYDHIKITVSDTGEGIPKEKMKHLFQRFQDGDYRQHKTIGTGLGLSLTRDLVYLHRGTIECESEEGKGTSFIVTLPINKEAFTPEQIDERHTIDFSVPKNAIIDFNTIVPDVNEEFETESTIDEDTYKLLIVEDNVELLMLMKQLLKSYYQVFAANNGVEALRIIHEKELDIIISDVMMPEMDGYELTRNIKADDNYNHLPIILLTAKTQEEDKQAGLLVGADDYLTKPFRLGDLKLRIDNIVENRKRIQREYSQQTIAETMKKLEKAPSPDEEFLSRALELVNIHLEDEDYDRDALATDMGTSTSTLYNKLRSITGLNVSSFIRDIRMKEASRIAIETPGIRVSDLAYRVGFKDPRYFSTCFKKHFGVQPKEYIESLQSKPET